MTSSLIWSNLNSQPDYNLKLTLSFIWINLIWQSSMPWSYSLSWIIVYFKFRSSYKRVNSNINLISIKLLFLNYVEKPVRILQKYEFVLKAGLIVDIEFFFFVNWILLVYTSFEISLAKIIRNLENIELNILRQIVFLQYRWKVNFFYNKLLESFHWRKISQDAFWDDRRFYSFL